MVQQKIELTVPGWWVGSTPEWYIYWSLTKLKIPFDYQSPFMGGRLEKGGLIADFVVPSLNLIINIQSTYWHYGRAGALAYDRMQREALIGQGYTVIYIDEEDALSNPIHFVQKAIKGIDHSRMTRG